MKAVFITYNQAYNEEIIELLEKNHQRGFTRWEDVQGKGGFNGRPHMGSHGWPELNHAVLTVIKDEKLDSLMADIKATDEASPDLGLRAFVWNIETML